MSDQGSSKPRRHPDTLRSHRWYSAPGLRTFAHRSRTAQMGYRSDDYIGKPVIAILNTWSDINPCHAHFKQRVEEVKRGMWSAGGFPVELPVMTLAEDFQKPTTMLYRNFLAMETEEVLRSYPADGAVLMGGCDKTTPALIMGATSVNLPAIYLPAGPMLRGDWRGEPLGSGSDVWKYWAELRAGTITEGDWCEIEQGIARSPGHCMTMGTASTMTSAAEALGPDAAWRGVDSGRGFSPRRDGGGDRRADRRDGLGGSDAVGSAQRAVVSQRGHDGARDRRIDQRDHSPHRDGAARRRGARPRRVRRAWRGRRRSSRTSGPSGAVPDGRLLLRRRVARAAGRPGDTDRS